MAVLGQLRVAVFNRLTNSKENQQDKLARAEEEERLDRIRNPHKYRPDPD